MVSSSRSARPFQTLRVDTVPVPSTHSVEPLSGLSKRLTCVFQLPMLKSKSCCPSRAIADPSEEAVCAAHPVCVRKARSKARKQVESDRAMFIMLYRYNLSGYVKYPLSPNST